MNKTALIISACLLLLLVVVIWGVVSRSTGPVFPMMTVQVTGTAGQSFSGTIRTNGHAQSISGVVPAQFPLGGGRFAFTIEMAGGAGDLTNTFFQGTNVWARGSTTNMGERLAFERLRDGRVGLHRKASNHLFSINLFDHK